MKRYIYIIMVLAVSISMILTISGCKETATTNAETTAVETVATETTAAAATTAETTAAAATTAAEKEFTIGIVLKSVEHPFWLIAKAAAERAGEELGVNVIVLSLSAENAYEEEVKIIEDLATKDIDLMAVVPAEASAIQPIVESVIASGIPVIILDSPLESEKPISFIGSDNVKAGGMGAEFIANQLNGEGKVAVIRGMLGNPVETQRYDGFVGKLAEFSGMELVAEGVADWALDKGMAVMEDFLSAHPDIQAVFAEADDMIMGAYSAAHAAGRDDIILVGLNGEAHALRAVKQGKIAADVAQRPDLMGTYAVEMGLKYLQTGEIEKVINTPIVVAIPDNVDELIANWTAIGY